MGVDLTWFPFYVDRFLTSRKVKRLKPEEVGWYIKLLCYQWKDGYIHNDFDEMAMLCDCSSDAIRGAWPRLGQCFAEQDGLLFNETLEAIRDEQLEKVEKYRKAGRKGAEARWGQDGNRSATALRPQSDGNGIRVDKSRVEESREEKKRKDSDFQSQDEKQQPDKPPPSKPRVMVYEGTQVAASLVDKASTYTSRVEWDRATKLPHAQKAAAWHLSREASG